MLLALSQILASWRLAATFSFSILQHLTSLHANWTLGSVTTTRAGPRDSARQEVLDVFDWWIVDDENLRTTSDFCICSSLTESSCHVSADERLCEFSPLRNPTTSNTGARTRGRQLDRSPMRAGPFLFKLSAVSLCHQPQKETVL